MTFYRKFKKFSVKKILALDVAFTTHPGGSPSYRNGFGDQDLPDRLAACQGTSGGGPAMGVCLRRGPCGERIDRSPHVSTWETAACGPD